jgi:hypothetical protein
MYPDRTKRKAQQGNPADLVNSAADFCVIFSNMKQDFPDIGQLRKGKT